jgi:glycosyltransferase involved in cell wall biosynthesis
VLSLSVLVPVYNEQYLISASLNRLKILEKCSDLSRVEIIVVDDGSTDSTPHAVDAFRAELAATTSNDRATKISWTFLRHDRNQGKGEAVKTALAHATCDVTVIHDSDLEYDPKDLLRLVKVFAEHDADAVFGSRFAGGEVRRVLFYRHQIANKLIALACNLVTNLNLTDIETCYKAIRTPLFRSIPIESKDFRIEPELTIKLAKRGARVFEVPISYFGRSYQEGKKIGLRDAFLALIAIVRFAISDHVYTEDRYGSEILARLSRAHRFNAWMADTIREFCGEHILEIGSGVGTLTMCLIPRISYTASDINPLYLESLNALCTNRPYLAACYCDLADTESFQALRFSGKTYDTVICLNVLEHIDDHRTALRNIKSVLSSGGRAIVLVPQGLKNFGTLDHVLGHKRRYTRQSLARLADECGFAVRRLFEFNRVGTVAWFLNCKLLRRRRFGLLQISILNLMTPLFRLLDHVLPIPGLSLIAILEARDWPDSTTPSGPGDSFAAAAKSPVVAAAEPNCGESYENLNLSYELNP